MSNIGFATLQIIPSLKGAGDALKGVIPAADKTGDAAGKSLGSKMKGGLLGSLKGIAGPIAAAFAGVQVVSFLKDSIGEAREAEKVGKITAQTITATGGAAKISADQVGDLATAISNKTGIDDEAIQSGANLLLTFKNVRNEVGAGANIFDRATQAATDLSAAGFGDLSGTSKQLGKALNDPLKGISALGKAGVTFTAGQQKMIKGFVESGDLLSAQKIILGEVEHQVGGVAAASATAGEKASVAFGNFKETVGTALLPVLDKLENIFTSKIAPAISGFAQGLTDGTGAGGRFAAIVKTAASAAADGFANFKTRVLPVLITFGKYIAANVVPAAQNLYKAIAPLVKSAVELGISIGSKVLPVVASLAKTLAGGVISSLGAVAKFVGDNATLFQSLAVGLGAALVVWKAWQLALTIGTAVMKGISIVTKGFAAAQALLNVVLSLNPIGLVVIALVALAAGLVYAYKHSEEFRNIVNAVFGAVRDFVVGAVTAVKNAVVTAWDAIKSATVTAWNAVKSAVLFVWNSIRTTVTQAVNTVKAVITGAWNVIKAVTSAVWNGIKAAISAVIGFVVSYVTTRVNLIKSVFSTGFNTLKSIVSGAFNGIKGAVTDGINAVVGFVSGIKSRISGALGNVGGILRDAGASIINGLFDGLKAAWSKVEDWVGSRAQWIKDHKGPLSYDAKLLTPAGNAIIEGLQRGMEAQLPALQKFLGDVTSTIEGGLTASPTVALSATGLAGSARLDARGVPITGAASATNQRPITVTVSADDPDATARKVGRFLANTGV